MGGRQGERGREKERGRGEREKEIKGEGRQEEWSERKETKRK